MSQATDTSMEGSIMTDLEHLSTQELKAILDETEQRIHEIRAELVEADPDADGNVRGERTSGGGEFRRSV